MLNSLKVLKSIYKNISLKTRRFIFLSIFLLVFTAFFEIITLLSLYEFLSFVIKSFNQSIDESTQILKGFSFLNIIPFPENYSLFLIIILNLIIRLSTGYFQVITITKVANELSEKSFTSLLSLDRTNFAQEEKYSESNLINTLVTQFNIFVAGILTPIFNIFTCSSLIFVLLIGAFSLSKYAASILFGVVITSYILVFIFTTNIIKVNSIKLFKNNNFLISSLQDTLSLLEVIQLRNLEKSAFDKFKKFSSILRSTEAENAFLVQLPKIIVEAIFLITVIFVILHSLRNNSIQVVSSQIAVIYSLQRIIILSQQLVGSIINLRSYTPALESVRDLIAVPNIHKITKSKSKFTQNFENSQENIDKDFNRNDLKLEILDLKVKRKNTYIHYPNLVFDFNSNYSIIGKSGCGKSTLMQILIGNFNPIVKGKIFLNNKLLFDADKKFIDKELYINWRKTISYVGQSPVIMNSSLVENIFFGNEELNKIRTNKIEDILKDVLLLEKVKSLRSGIYSEISNKGPLSGGQNQRVSIAREILSIPQRCLLFLDEPVSAVDTETAKKIYLNLLKKDPKVRLIVVTHQPEILNFEHKTIRLSSD